MGLQNQPFLGAGQWQAQISFQYANTDDLYVGDKRNDAAGPFGQPPHRQVSIFNLDVLYALSNRVTLDLTVPYLTGSGGFQMGTEESHSFYKQSASGFGDISLEAQFWLSDPTKASPVQGSVSVGFIAPTGSDTKTGQFPGGAVGTIDEAFQLGNGGWTLLLRAQGSAEISPSFSAYGSGYYGVSLTEHTEVFQYLALRSVPDTYSGRLGVAYLLPVPKGFVVSVGGRINGVTVRDLIGGGDLYWRRPGYEVFVEPGLTWTQGPNMASVSVPVRVYANKLDSLLDQSLGIHIPAAFVPYLVLVSYARRF